jgi:hypothetical protein
VRSAIGRAARRHVPEERAPAGGSRP